MIDVVALARIEHVMRVVFRQLVHRLVTSPFSLRLTHEKTVIALPAVFFGANARLGSGELMTVSVTDAVTARLVEGLERGGDRHVR